MARTTVFLRLPGETNNMYARTDLHGYGPVRVGEEFTARQMWPMGRDRIIKGGRRLRVLVVRVDVIDRNYHILHVEVLQDLTPGRVRQEELFDG